MSSEGAERVRLKPHPTHPFGIVLSKNVMVPMRDGVRLAFDIYRPARDGGFVEGRFPTIMLHTPYDKTDKRYSEIADFFVPHGYNVVLIDLRDRYCSEASGVYYHAATPHTGRDGYDVCEWIGTQPWSNGRIGTVGSSYAAITQVRTALEAPPHLTAIWPDVVPTNSFQNQCREGGAMQQHMFWALFIHAQDAQDVRDDWSKAGEVWADLENLRQLYRATPWTRGQTSLRHVPPLEDSLLDYYTRGTYDEYWDRIEHNYTRFWDQHADIPATFSTGWYDPFPAADSEYFAAMTEKNGAPQRLVIGPWSHVGMRGDATFCHEVDFGPQSVWGVQRYFEEQLDFFDRWLPDAATGQPSDEAPVRIFVMGGGSGLKTAGGKLDHGGRWREEQEWPIARAVITPFYLHGDGGLSTEEPASGAAPRAFTFDPAHPVPTLGGLYCSIGELPADGPGMEPAWARLLNPVLRLRDLLTPGPVDQKESPAFYGSEEPFPRLSERPDVLVFQTEPLTEPIEVTGPMEVHLWISSSAVDTDFTAKVVDVHPANEDYPDGFDMLINDSIIRCRYREGFDREVFLEPGVPVPVTITLPPTSNLFDVGHRIRVDISSSNWPRLDVNPNTGEPTGRHTHQVVAKQTVYVDVERPSHILLPVIPEPDMTEIEWRLVPAGPFTMGSDPARAYPPAADETPRRVVDVAPFRIGRIPVTNAQYAAFVSATGHRPPSSWPDATVPHGQEGVPVTYVSWHDAGAFCAWAGGRLASEVEWEAAASGGDGRLWPWGDVPPDRTRAVFEAGVGGPAAAGQLEASASPCGALEMAGNVAEWVASGYEPHPAAGDSTEPRVVRGGSYLHGPDALRCSVRRPLLSGAIDTYVGFRIAADPSAVVAPTLDLVDVVGGSCLVGRDPVEPGGEALADELPAATVEVPAYEISTTPVTNAAYAAFVREAGHRSPVNWPDGEPPPGTSNQPVTWVDAGDAEAFCAWLGGRLPTEAQWEKAARSDDARTYPWGETPPDETRATYGSSMETGPSPIGASPAGTSPYGLLDVAGNVWEWVSSAYAPYPYEAGDGREEAHAAERTLRGGSYASPAVHLRCAARSRSYPGRLAPHIGFRVARAGE